MTQVIQANRSKTQIQDAIASLESVESLADRIYMVLTEAGVGEEKLNPDNARIFATYLAQNGSFESTDGKAFIELGSLGVSLGKAFKHGVDGITDGSHNFNELYDHRCTLFVSLMSIVAEDISSNPYGIKSIWHSRLHDDGTGFDDYTVVGIETEYGQATYHVPDAPFGNHLRRTYPMFELERAPEWDGHTSNDVLVRLSSTFLGQSLWGTEKKEVEASES